MYVPMALKKIKFILGFPLPSLSTSNNQLSNCYPVVKSFSRKNAETCVSYPENQ